MTEQEGLPVVEGEIVWDPESGTYQLGVPDDAPAGRCIVHAELDLSTGGFAEMTIRDFINDRLDDDEAAALGAKGDTPGVWDDDGDPATWIVLYDKSGKLTMGQHRHIADHDPARALHQVAAGRDVLERHFNEGEGAWPMACIGCPDSTMDGGPTVDHVDECPELQALAWWWSDDPAWNLKWCPHIEGRRVMEVTDHRDSRPCYTNACVRCGQGDGWHYGNPAENA